MPEDDTVLRVEHMIQILPHAVLVVLVDFAAADVLRLLHVRRIPERILQGGLLTVVSAGRTGGGGFIGRAATAANASRRSRDGKWKMVNGKWQDRLLLPFTI